MARKLFREVRGFGYRRVNYLSVTPSTLWQLFLDLTLPRECPACRASFESHSVFCPECEREFTTLESAARCTYCAAPLTLPGAPCGHCLGSGLPLLEKIVCLGILKDPLQTAIHRAKYEHRWPLVERLVDRLIQRNDVQAMLDHAEVLVPVPLHRSRQIERGYNQAEVIARRLVKHTPRPLTVTRAAQRIRNTENQTHLHSRAERTENLKDAFELVGGSEIEGKNVVLIDDVLTSGATMLSLARVLKPANPSSFAAIVLAVADPKGRAFESV